MQPPGGAGFALEPLQMAGSPKSAARQNFQGNVSSEGLLNRLVDDTHATAADFTQQAILTQVARAGRIGFRWVGEGSSPVGGPWLELLQELQGGEDVADLVGEVRILLGVLAQRGAFAEPAALGKFLGEALDRVALGT